MSCLRIDYIVPVSKHGYSGRAKASREKAKALQQVAPRSRIFLLSSRNRGRVSRLLAALALELRYTVAVLRGGPPDAIVTRSSLPMGPLLIRWLYRVPLFKEMHADLGDEAAAIANGNVLLKATLRVAHIVDIWSARRMDGVIFNHPALERHVAGRYLSQNVRTTSVANGTDPTIFRMLDRDACRVELGLRRDGRYLVWVGDISPWHAVDTLLKLSDELPPNHEILIVGPTSSKYARDLVRASTSSRANFLGPATPELAIKYMNAADACLLPVAPTRVSPGSALKLYDYAACGVPVICQEHTEGYSDVVLETGIGIAVDFYDPPAAATRISEFLLAAASRREAIRETAENFFAWQRRMEAWLGFIAQKS